MGFQSQCGSQIKETFAEVGRGKLYLIWQQVSDASLRGPLGENRMEPMSRVLVIDQQRRPLMPTTPARARILLKAGKAAVWRRFPFTLILREAKPEAEVVPLRLKIDPGSRTTGLAVLNDTSGQVVWAAELTHRGEEVHQALLKRAAVRRGRRYRHTRYRQPRW